MHAKKRKAEELRQKKAGQNTKRKKKKIKGE
jgi:hypothetical protein